MTEIKPPNETGSTQAIVRWMLDTPEGWVGSWDKDVLLNLQRDAERYRKLRALHWSNAELAVVESPRANVMLGATCPSGEHLDSLIDQIKGET